MVAPVIGEQLQKQILEWFNEHYPEWWVDWMEGEFDAYERLPLELKMIPAFRILPAAATVPVPNGKGFFMPAPMFTGNA